MTFEEKLKRLEEIVAELESEKYGLEKTIELFQEGMALVKECKKILDNNQLKVNEIMSTGSDSADEEPF
ncbi:MAG: exodeoxyribonuclease VII small subunit [Calditerrivibrio sp.]|nr:exodeoxyribonuclease VII small subunit [Calditerrivibrio sp.]